MNFLEKRFNEKIELKEGVWSLPTENLKNMKQFFSRPRYIFVRNEWDALVSTFAGSDDLFDDLDQMEKEYKKNKEWMNYDLRHTIKEWCEKTLNFMEKEDGEDIFIRKAREILQRFRESSPHKTFNLRESSNIDKITTVVFKYMDNWIRSDLTDEEIIENLFEIIDDTLISFSEDLNYKSMKKLLKDKINRMY